MREIILLTAASLIMSFGLIGTIVPMMPGALLIWIGTLCYAMGTNFAKLTLGKLLFLLALTLFSWLIDYLFTLYGTKKFGKSSFWGVFGASIGLIIGILGSFFGQFYLIVLAPAVGAIIFEIIAGKELKRALRAGFGSFLGFMLGRFSCFLIGILTIILFFIFIS